MKNPNGYGSIFKLSGNRRKPYTIRVTVGFKDGKQKYKYLSYHVTRKEAMQALAVYNSNPYNLNESDVTFAELYEKWSLQHYKNIGKNTIKGYLTSYKYCEPLYKLKIKDIRAMHMQSLVDNLNKNYGTLRLLKNMWIAMFKLAMELDIIQKDYSQYVKLPKHTIIKHKSIFTDEEIQVLWENVDKIKNLDSVLIMIYSGMRIGELLNLKKEDVDLINKSCVVTESKTKAGHRAIPIHSKIFGFFKERFGSEGKYILSLKKSGMSYNTYLKQFNVTMKELNMNHTPHDCRHTFATLLNDAGGNKTAIKKLIGHESFELTEKVYTHKKIDELRKALELIN